jgi:hypothetical protein
MDGLQAGGSIQIAKNKKNPFSLSLIGPRSKTEERLTYTGVKQDIMNTTVVGFGLARNSLQDDSDDEKIDEALRASF